MKKTTIVLFSLPVLLLLVLTIYLFLESSKWYNYSKLLETKNAQLNETLIFTKQKLEEEKSTSAALRLELADTNRVLNETNISLGKCASELSKKEELLEGCMSRNEELISFLLETRHELQNLSSELSAFQEQINESMSWFTENSNLANMSPRLRYLADKCTTNREINAACIPVAVRIEDGWEYKRDEGDKLLSIREFAENKGGDCEDWSLYFKAAYNYLKEEDRPERTIISAVPGTGDFKIYGNYYYAGAEKKPVGTTEDNLYVICYDSHCVVAVSKFKIENGSDVYMLRGAPAIEPQTGEYLFTVGEGPFPDVCSEEKCGYNDIWIIITDNDIYNFRYNWKWIGYRDYYNLVVYYKNKTETINAMISENVEG